MSYIHYHEILKSKEMVIGHIAAEVQLRPGGDSLPYEGASGPAAHGHPLHRHIHRPGRPDCLEGELFLDIPDGLFRCHRAGQVPDRPEAGPVTFTVENFYIPQPESARHGTAYAGNHLVSCSVRGINRDTSRDSLHDRKPYLVFRRYPLQPGKNERMMRHNHVRPRLNGLIHKFRSTIQPYQDRMHRGIRRADTQPAVVPALLNRQRGEIGEPIHSPLLSQLS